MTDLRDSIDMWTERLIELTGGDIDEDEARALIAEIHDSATVAYREGVAEMEAEREE
ncbi:hypothetical protein [Streptomyces sp. 6N223]|uniref:hypothetical protein n=1 Tax=Streptomyces sp. 6N223 TaxID=3457412 RepID=UPI003FD42854